LPETQTMDEYIQNLGRAVPLIYKLTTLACKSCGYEVSY
jgi:hypothetical protein